MRLRAISQFHGIAIVHGNAVARQLGSLTYVLSSKPVEDHKDPVHANHSGPETKPPPADDPTAAEDVRNIEPIDPKDPAVEDLDNMLHFNMPASPPGVARPRPMGSADREPLHVNPVSPRGDGAANIKPQMPRHARGIHGALDVGFGAGRLMRHFSSNFEVNPAGGRAGEFGDGDKEVVVEDVVEDVIVEETVVAAGRPAAADAAAMGTSAHINPPAYPTSMEATDPFVFQTGRGQAAPRPSQTPANVSRFDEQPGGTGLGSVGSSSGLFGRQAQRSMAEKQVAGMGTGGFVSPPPGQVFDGDNDHPAVGAHGPPGSVRDLGSSDPAVREGGFAAGVQDGWAQRQAAGMATGGAVNPAPGQAFAADGCPHPVGGNRALDAGELGGPEAPLEDPNYTVAHDSSVPPGVAPPARGFFTAPAWWNAAEDGAPGSVKRSTKKIQTNPTTEPIEVPGTPGEGPEPVHAGRVVGLQTGVNTLGGTPVKPAAERGAGDQLHNDTESMHPTVSPQVEKWASNMPRESSSTSPK